MALVFVAAEAREFVGILRHADGVQKLAWAARWSRGGHLNGQSAIFVANGPGPALAAAAAAEALEKTGKVSGFISTGFCGALDDGLRCGDIFVANAVNGELACRPRTERPFAAGALVSQDRVACALVEKQRLRQTGAGAVEMEASGVARVARDAGIPFYCVRVVSDAAGDALPLDFNRMRNADGRFSRSRIVLAACRHPGRIFPELLRFDRTCKSAAMALGDFLADCRF